MIWLFLLTFLGFTGLVIGTFSLISLQKEEQRLD
jgi:protein-S-isoprenylcysteine O-methyltransferase Ste14